MTSFQIPYLNIVLVGDRNVGKSTLIAKCHEIFPTSGPGGYFTKDFVSPDKPTSLACYPTSVYRNGKEGNLLLYSVFRANIIDTGGAKIHDDIRPFAYKDADIFMVCFDTTNSSSFANVSRWINEVRKYESKKPIILVGNKTDLIQGREVSSKEAKELAKSFGLDDDAYIETAYNDQNTVQDAFTKAVERASLGRQMKGYKKCRKNKPESNQETYDVTNLEPPSSPPDYPKNSSTQITDLKSVLQSKIGTDVIIKCHDDHTEIHAHKYILSLASKHLRELLLHFSNTTLNNEDESYSPICRLSCLECKSDKYCALIGTHVICIQLAIKKKIFEHLLYWMYTGCIGFNDNVDMDLKVEVHKVARMLEIESLCRKIIPLAEISGSTMPASSLTIYKTGPQASEPDQIGPVAPPPLASDQIVPLAQPPPPLPSDQIVPLALPPPPLPSDQIVPLAPPPPPLPSDQIVPLAPTPPPLPSDQIVPLAPPPPPLPSDQIVPLAPPPPPLPSDQIVPLAASPLLRSACKARPPPSFLESYQMMWSYSTKELNQFLTDLTLIIEGISIEVHRFILVARSPVMAVMLEGTFKESNQKEIQLHGISLQHFLDLLDFMYTDNCTLDLDNIYGVLELADRFMIKSLVHRCEQFLINRLENTDKYNIIEDLVLESLFCSKAFYANNLLHWCLHFMSVNYYVFQSNYKDIFRRMWSDHSDFMEQNLWPPMPYLKILNDYKFKSRINALSKRPQDKITKCQCNIM